MFKVSVPDNRHWREQIKCQSACPVYTDARGYIRAIRDSDYERAYLIARGPNPLASICGRICGAPCEVNCRRADIDATVSIRALKRFASEEYLAGDAARLRAVIESVRATAGTLECADLDELSGLAVQIKSGAIRSGAGEKVAIIGSGPAGLAAAQDLAILGFKPVIYEAERVAGGLLALGVPEYRLPREVVQAEVDVIRTLGVEIRTGVEVGKEIALSELSEDYAAVVIAVGARDSRMLKIQGVDAKGVYGGVEFLRDVSLGKPVELGRKIIVVGGGNVAFDVSRTALRRLGADISRTALRQPLTEEVRLCCLESREEMPADDFEIEEGSEEGVILHNSLAPDEILVGVDGAVKAVKFKRALSVFDGEGRFNPTFDDLDTTVIEGDTVILAIGQSFDFSFVDTRRDGIRFLPSGAFELDENLSTTREGVFVAGDAALGPKLMIDAIASGKKAARSVYQYLMGESLSFEETVLHIPLPGYSREARFERIPRQRPPTADVEERKRSRSLEVERRYSEEKAHLEADRCLDCGVNTIFDSNKCILCGGCADVCPELCLKLVPVRNLAGGEDFESLKERWQAEYGGAASAIIKNDERCIRCAACADRCPVGAITMERFTFQEACRCA